jgi:hypothetical protein
LPRERERGTLREVVSRFVLLLLGVPLLLSSACGPGLESLHASNVRFEHCYRLDMDPRIASSHRMVCWRDWTESYAIGQSRDRVEYARRRIITLESGDAELLSIETQPERRQRIFSVVGETRSKNVPMAAPAPTSAHAPPPKTAQEAAASPPDAPAPAAPLPGEDCGDACGATYHACQTACGGDSDACTTCRENFRDCMRACYE